MRRMSTVVLVVLVAGMAFAAGQAAPKLKFPWASEDLNAPAKITMLEQRCLEARIRTQPEKLKSYFDIVGLDARPTPDGLKVRLDFVPKKGLKMTKERAPGLLNDLLVYYARAYIEKHICPITDDFRDVTIVAFLDGKPVAKRDINGFELLAKF